MQTSRRAYSNKTLIAESAPAEIEMRESLEVAQVAQDSLRIGPQKEPNPRDEHNYCACVTDATAGFTLRMCSADAGRIEKAIAPPPVSPVKFPLPKIRKSPLRSSVCKALRFPSSGGMGPAAGYTSTWGSSKVSQILLGGVPPFTRRLDYCAGSLNTRQDCHCTYRRVAL